MKRPLRLGAATLAAASLCASGLAVLAPSPAFAENKGCVVKGPPVYVPEESPVIVDLGIEQTWALSRGAGVTVAVVDSGLEVRNAHFPKGSYLPGATMITGPGAAVLKKGNTDLEYHGTAVASIIAARPVKGSGLVGVAPDAKILPVQYYVNQEAKTIATGWGPSLTRMAAGIRYAATRGAKIINVSSSDPKGSPALLAAVRFAQAKGALVVASAGNTNTTQDKSNTPRYPAAYPGVLSVTASLTGQSAVTEDSIHGPHVSVAAPGDMVMFAYLATGDCIPDQSPAATSFSTAYVSGVAALIAARYPQEKPQQWAQRIISTSLRSTPNARNDVLGWGIVQPMAALTADVDDSLYGPVADGAVQPERVGPKTDALPRIDNADPYAAARMSASWWLLGGAVVIGLAVMAGLKKRKPVTSS